MANGGDTDDGVAARVPRALVVGAGVVLAVAALKLAQPVLVPLVAGLFLAVLARPLHLRLRAPLPRPLRWLGLVVTMLLVTAAVATFAGALAWTGRAVAAELRERDPEMEARLAGVREAAARAGISLPAGIGGGSSAGADPASTDPRDAERGDRAPGFVEGVARALFTGFGGLMLALAFAALGLAEAGEARARVAALRGAGPRRALDAIDEAAPAFRRYVWVKSLTSAITGLATALVTLVLGLPLAWVWGFLTFLLEYVPTVGSLLAVLPPVAMALATEGPARAAIVLLVVGAVQVILGNVVDPRIEGRLMAISPFGVLLSIVFWGWLWGVVGALLAVPLTVAVVIACRHVPGAQGVATLLAGDGVGTEEGPGTRDQGPGTKN